MYGFSFMNLNALFWYPEFAKGGNSTLSAWQRGSQFLIHRNIQS